MSSGDWGTGSRVLARRVEPRVPAEEWAISASARFPNARVEDVSADFVAQGTGLLVVCLLAAIAVATFIAATPWLRAYQVARAPLILALAALLPVAIAGALSGALRLPALISYGGSFAGLVVMLGVTNNFDFSAVWNGVVHVPAQLLTETLPLSGPAHLLTAPVVLTWLCGAISAELSVRPVHPSATAALVPVLCFSFAFVLTTSAPAGNSVAEAAALLGELMLWALARHAILERQRALVQAKADGSHSGRSGSVAWAATGAALAVLLAAALTLAVPGALSVSGKPKAVSRATPVQSNVVVDPVDALASLRTTDPGAPPKTLFDVQVLEPWSGYLPVAALDDYDGASWSFTATFQPTGGRVPATGEDAHVAGEDLEQRYTLVRSFGLPFLPAEDRPVQVSGLPVDADATTGMLAASPALPATYTVISEVPPGTLGQISPSSPIASGPGVPGGDSAAYTALPAGSNKDVAAGVHFSATLTGREAVPSLAFLQSLAQDLRVHERRISPLTTTGKKVSSDPLAGTSLAQVMNGVTVDRAATPEEFATFYAVVARYLGVPARVVTGFRVPETHPVKQLPAGGYKLTNRDAWTWVEIPVAGLGWVIVDPTPTATTTAASPPPEQVRATPPTVPKQATALPGNSAAHAIAKPTKVPDHQAVHVNWLLVFGIGLPAAVILVVLVGGLVVPAVRRRLRRVARHQPADPSLLATGAWLEFLDGLSRLGVEVSPAATSSEVADQVVGRFGDDFGAPTRFVGAAADQALYSTVWPLEDARARTAWDSQRHLYKAMRRTVGFEAAAQALLRVGNAPVRPSQPSPHVREHSASGRSRGDG